MASPCQAAALLYKRVETGQAMLIGHPTNALYDLGNHVDFKPSKYAGQRNLRRKS